MKTRWEGPFLYEPPGGDLAKDWSVWINDENPITGKMERGPGCRFFVGFKDFKTKTERRVHGQALIRVVDKLLRSGWSPYDEYNIVEA